MLWDPIYLLTGSLWDPAWCHTTQWWDMVPRSLQWYLKDAWASRRGSLPYSPLHSRCHFHTTGPAVDKATSRQEWASTEKDLWGVLPTCPKVPQIQHFARLEALVVQTPSPFWETTCLRFSPIQSCRRWSVLEPREYPSLTCPGLSRRRSPARHYSISLVGRCRAASSRRVPGPASPTCRGWWESRPRGWD